MELNELHVSIIGLGLMGGSLALALQPHVAAITGVDRDPHAVAYARERDVVSQATGDLALGVESAHLVILATPVRTIVNLLSELPALRPDGCLLLDLGSTKELIGREMERLPESFGAVGGHPLCGREVAGMAGATSALYRDKVFVLCRNRRTTAEAERVAELIVEAVGSTPLFLPAGEHDRLVATTSHLPYLSSAALMKLAAAEAAANDRFWQLCASGFNSATRLAGSNPAMMLDILLTNRDNVLRQLIGLRRELGALIEVLEPTSEVGVADWITAVRQQYDRYLGAT